jgi:hypothetical protein
LKWNGWNMFCTRHRGGNSDFVFLTSRASLRMRVRTGQPPSLARAPAGGVGNPTPPQRTNTKKPAGISPTPLLAVALAPERRINNGEPSLHAISLAALNVSKGEKIVHIGAGTGYYTAILAELTGKSGTVLAYEIEQDLAQRAATNLSSRKNISVIHQSGSEGTLPACDIIYVNAGATHPLDT